jgi:hypothetical protein
MHLVRAADGIDSRLAQAEITHLALLDEWLLLVPPRWPSGPRTLPNLVAIRTLSRLPLIALAISSSFLPAE